MLFEMVQRNSWIPNCQTGVKQYKSQLFNNRKSPPQDFIRTSLGLLKNGRNLPPNQTNTIGSIISLLLQLGLLKIGAWEMEWSWWWCHKKKMIFQILEFPIVKMAKGLDHSGASSDSSGAFLGSQWDRQLKFSAYASFQISWSLSKFELI